jgi:carbonic anhydrase
MKQRLACGDRRTENQNRKRGTTHMRTVEITYRYGAADGVVRPRPLNADSARSRLDAGNREFAALLGGLVADTAMARRVVEVDLRDLGLDPGGHATPRQRPFAAVIGCSDARVPIELVFNEGPNDLFVIRVAGNGLGGDVLGSLKYAVEHLSGSLRLVVVLAHSGCGALTAAVDVFLEPAGYLALATQHALRNILDRQLIVVQACAKTLMATLGPDVTLRPGYREALIETSIVLNAALTAHTVQQEIGRGASSPQAVYGVYLLQTREVWAPRAGTQESTGLAVPPADAASFRAFGEAVMRSPRIASLLRRA